MRIFIAASGGWAVQRKIASQCVIFEVSREIELAFFSTDTDFALQSDALSHAMLSDSEYRVSAR